jgi:excisionase family DNA binding protein
MPVHTEKDILTAEGLAERLEVSADTIKAWARQGKIPSLRPSPKVLRFSLKAVLAALDARQGDGRGN